MVTENLNQKILDNIIPFNDIFYRTCYLNALIPIIKHFNKSILPFLINEMIMYGYRNVDEKKIIEYIPVNPLNNILDKIGLKFITKPESGDLIRDIRRAISEGKPVILWIDCFYSPIRADMYHKNHWEHCMVVYGYDDNLQVCNIIEHKNRDNLSYEAQVMKFQDILNCCKGYVDQFYNRKIDMPVYMEFYTNPENICAAGEKSLHSYIHHFKDNMSVYKENLYARIETLKDYREDFEYVTGCRELLDKKIENMLTALNQAINIKQVESYRLNKLFGSHLKLLELQNEIVMKWKYIRKVIAKYMYSSIYKEDVFCSATETIEQIYELEIRFNMELFNLLEQHNP